MSRRILFSLLIVLLLVTACSPSSSPAPSPSPAPAVAIDRPLVTFTEVTNCGPKFINPIWLCSHGQHTIYQHVWMGMMRITPDWTFEPWIAESYNINSQCTTATFNLNPKAKWSDGQPLTAKDVEFSWKLYNHPKLGREVSSWIRSKIWTIKGAEAFRKGETASISGITVVNDHQIQAELEKPDCLFLKDMAHAMAAIQPKHILEPDWDKFGPETRDQIAYLNNPSVVSGAYKLDKVEFDHSLEYARVDQWWGNDVWKKPAISRLVLRVLIRDMAVMQAQLQANEMHIALVEGTERDRLARLSNVALHQSTGLGWMNYPLNERTLPDQRVRQAFDYALDKDAIRKAVLHGLGEPLATGIWTPWALHPTIKPRPYDPAKARALLQEAGWDFNRTIDFLDRAGGPRGELFKAYLEDIGVKVNLKILAGSAWQEATQKLEWDVAYTEGGTIGEDPNQICIYNGANSARVLRGDVLAFPRFNELCTLINSSPDNQVRRPYALEMQQILFDKTWNIPFSIMEDIYGVDARLDGFVAPKSRNTRIFENILDYRWKS